MMMHGIFDTLAFFDPGEIAIMIPIIIFMIPIVAILTSHQQKMAEIVSRNRATAPNPDIEALRAEVADLKALVHQQAIAMDNMISLQTRMTPDIQQRFEQPVGRDA